MHFLGGDDADSEVSNDFLNINSFEQTQLSEIASMVLDLLRDPKGSAFQERLGGFAEAHGVNVPALKTVSRGIIMFFRGATRHNVSPEQVAEDCLALGMSEEATDTLRNAWAVSYKSLANVSVRSTLMANQLIDMEWKFGVTAASDELSQVGVTFLHMKLVVDKGDGKREDVFMELTLPQFYDFMADMEKAKTYIDYLSN